MGYRRGLGVFWIGVTALVGGGCGIGAADETVDLAEARRFDSYRVYYVGREFHGQELEPYGAKESPPDSRATVWFFVYGHCEPDEFPEGEGGCAPPLQIHNYSVCTRRPTFEYASRTFKVGEAMVVEDGEGRLELATGTTMITIGGDKALVHAAVRSLRTVREARPGPLPPAVPGALQGTLPCQHISEKALARQQRR
jgi:hypothetical protein